MKKINKFSSFLIIMGIVLIPLLTISETVLADGMVIKLDPYSDRWDYLEESNQLAFISYEDGLQKMILSIGIEEAEENAIWIFPVPADPEKVVIDIMNKMPKLRGEEINKKAKSNLSFSQEALFATQIYTVLLPVSLSGTKPDAQVGTGGPYSISNSLGGSVVERDVVVHEHLVKKGITTEIITAKTAQALYQYFEEKGLKVEKNSIPVLDYYIGKEFTFVVSWISGQDSLAGQRGIFITFPTEKIYFPLFPTSVYGSQTIPITIRIMGFVSPEVFDEIKNYTEISYYFNATEHLHYDDAEAELMSEFFNPLIKNDYGMFLKLENVKYTKIEINAPSKMFTEDLWINNRAPLGTVPILFIAKYPIISTIIFLIFISILAGLLAGIIVFREARNKRGLIKFGLVGVFNCFSIIGLIIATFSVETKRIKEEDKELFAELKKRGYSVRGAQSKDLRKLGFIPLFSVLFLLLSWAIIGIIKVIL